MGMWHAINLLNALVKSPSQANLALDWPLSGENAHKSSGANYLMTNQSPPELGNFTYLAFQTPYEVFSKPSIRKRSVFVWIILGHQCCHILASKGQQNISPAGMPLEKFANIVHLSTVDHPKIFFCVVLLHLLQGKLRKIHFSNAPLLFASLYIRRVQRNKVQSLFAGSPGTICPWRLRRAVSAVSGYLHGLHDFHIEVAWFSAGVFDQTDSFLLWICSIVAVSRRERTVPPSGWIPTWLQRIYDRCSWISLWRNTNTLLSLPRLPFHMKTQPCCLRMLGWIRWS